IWTVEKMEVNGVERAPLVTDWGRWRRVIVQNATTMMFWRMDDTFVSFPATVDARAGTIAFTNGDKQPIGKLTYAQQTPEILVLDGDLNGQKLHLETRLFDKKKFLLLGTGFHWVQERPFNK